MSYQCYEDITTQADAWRAALAAVDERIEDFEEFFSGQADEILFAACGSTYYLGLAVAPLLRERLGRRVTVVPSSEIMLYPETVLPRGGKPILIVASRSGETSETVRAAETFAEKFPGRTVLIGCRPDSRLHRLADLSIVIPEGDESVVPQTRSFGSMHLAAQYLAALLAGDDELADALRRLPDLLPGLLSKWEPAMKEVAQADWESAVFLGGGPLYGVAVEASLKLTEMSLSQVASYHTLEVRHGPRSVIDQRTLVIGLGSRRGASHERRVFEELSGETPHVLAFTPRGGWDLGESVTEVALENDLPDYALGSLYLPPLQLLAYHRALRNEVNPDESRNLTGHVELSDRG